MGLLSFGASFVRALDSKKGGLVSVADSGNYVAAYIVRQCQPTAQSG